MQLSKHFSYEEMTRTQVRAPNDPGPVETEALKKLLAFIMEPAREMVGPIWITSGYRSWNVNARIGGASQSQHCRGEAADWVPMEMGLKEAFRKIMQSEIPYDQLIFEVPNGLQRGWIHTSYNTRAPRQRRQVLICTGPGKFEPFSEELFGRIQ